MQGGVGADDIRIAFGDGGWTVSDSHGIFAGDGCAGRRHRRQLPGRGRHQPARRHGRQRQRQIDVDGSVPGGVKVRANGNAGSDSLSGGPGDDVLEAGENYNGPDDGNDSLTGNAGSDVLYADPGGDQLSGGPGNDLLVSSVAVCQGHSYNGGSGDDTVSYGRSDADLQVELGGTGAPSGCGNPDRVGADNESLEGSDGPDVLIGDNGENSFLGHLGADIFLGKGGNDFIDAADGKQDKMICCGGGGDDDVQIGPRRPEPGRLLRADLARTGARGPVCQTLCTASERAGANRCLGACTARSHLPWAPFRRHARAALLLGLTTSGARRAPRPAAARRRRSSAPPATTGSSAAAPAT